MPIPTIDLVSDESDHDRSISETQQPSASAVQDLRDTAVSARNTRVLREAVE
jgi:hypothetical protein